MTILEAAAALRAREVSSAELVEASLAAIERHNPRINAFLTVTGDVARAAARQADQELARGKVRGPLHGIPVALKDVFCTKGIRTTCGSALYRDHVPDYDSAVAEKLGAAGAVLCGKTGMHELAYGITSNNPHFGAVRNPWNTGCIPGGSSGGSGAAVAAGMVFMAMGSDTGGSIRIPASFCGVAGLKPTSGRVSRYGVLPLDFTLDHMGPLARSVRDAAAALDAIAGYDPRDDSSSRVPWDGCLPGTAAVIKDARVGLPENYYLERSMPEVVQAVRRMAETAAALGARVETVRAPDIAALNTVGRVILLAEAAAAMSKHIARREMFGADVLALLDQGRMITAVDYVNAQRLRRLLRADFRKLFGRIDCLLTPATPSPAPKIGQTTLEFDGVPEDVRLASTRLVRGVNVLGYPALAMPCGVDGAGMPLGLQIIARPFEERLLMKVGAALEDATEFHHLGPPGL